MTVDPAPPAPEVPPGLDDPAARRKLRRIGRFLQVGGVVFLLVVSLGLLPRILADVSPALARAASTVAWFAAPVLTVGLLVFAVLRLRR